MAITQTANPLAAYGVHRIGLSDLSAALRAGWRDFMAAPTQILFLCVLYPVLGLVFARAASAANVWALVWPLLSGFVLVGPLAALGLYEISRRREQGLEVSWRDCFRVLRSPALGSIIGMGLLMLAIYLAWLVTAQGVLLLTLGAHLPEGFGAFLATVFETERGLMLLLLGNVAGFCFAVLVLAVGSFSLPMMLDRNASMGEAIAASWRAFNANRVVMLAWGLVVATGLFFGMLTLMVGLAVTLPLLGHATWHLYRRVFG